MKPWLIFRKRGGRRGPHEDVDRRFGVYPPDSNCPSLELTFRMCSGRKEGFEPGYAQRTQQAYWGPPTISKEMADDIDVTKDRQPG